MLGALLAISLAVGLGLGIALATRARRNELAVLRALGCEPGQLASSVRWHSLTVIGVALLLGVPLGLALGRTIARASSTSAWSRVSRCRSPRSSWS